jgi:hypothetical protein
MGVHVIPELDAKGLRIFALSGGGIIAVLFGLVFPWLFDLGYFVWPWVVAGVLVAWGFIHPLSLNLVYRGWMKFGLLLNKITTPIILGLVFFGLFTPLALGMRLFGRDTMNRRFDDNADTYRKQALRRDKKSIENPF